MPPGNHCNHQGINAIRIKINSPAANKDFGITPVPCTDLDCEKFSLRGNKIEDGFRAK